MSDTSVKRYIIPVCFIPIKEKKKKNCKLQNLSILARILTLFTSLNYQNRNNNKSGLKLWTGIDNSCVANLACSLTLSMYVYIVFWTWLATLW